MKPRGLLTAVVLLAVLAGVIWWSNRKQASASKSTETSTTKLLTIIQAFESEDEAIESFAQDREEDDDVDPIFT